MTSASTQSTPLAMSVDAPAARAAGLHRAAGETALALGAVVESSAVVAMEILRFDTTRAGGNDETMDSAVSRAHRPTVPTGAGTHAGRDQLHDRVGYRRPGRVWETSPRPSKEWQTPPFSSE